MINLDSYPCREVEEGRIEERKDGRGVEKGRQKAEEDVGEVER